MSDQGWHIIRHRPTTLLKKIKYEKKKNNKHDPNVGSPTITLLRLIPSLTTSTRRYL